MKKSTLLLGLLLSAPQVFAAMRLDTVITLQDAASEINIKREATIVLEAGQAVVAPVAERMLLSLSVKPTEKENIVLLVVELYRVVGDVTESAEPTLELVGSVEVEAEFGKEVVVPCPSEVAQAELKVTVTQE